LNKLKSLAFKHTLASRERCSSTSSISSTFFDWIKVIGGTLGTEYIHYQATSHIHPDLLTALDEFDKRNTSLRYSLKLLDDDKVEDNEWQINN
jgi:hypothetical protein